MFSKSKKDKVSSKEENSKSSKDESRTRGGRKKSSGGVVNVEEDIPNDEESDNYDDPVINLTPTIYVDPVIAKLKNAKVCLLNQFVTYYYSHKKIPFM